MAMPARIQVVLRTVDNVPENYVTNSFALWTDSGADTSATETALIAFYNAIKGMYSGLVAGTGHQIRWSALPGTPPNYPFRITTWDFSGPAPSGATLPSEVACVLSFQGSKAAGFPQARRRGRIYLGPLVNTMNVNGRPDSGTRTNVANHASTLKTALAAPGGQHWAVWSVADQATVEIQDGWLDDAFDTQRRRGVRLTSRIVWS